MPCAGNSKRLCSNEKCKTCFNRSFANHEKAQFWSSCNECTPRNIFISTGKKFWFECGECGHYFNSSPNHIAKGRWCPYCSGHKLCGDIECKICFDRSFASHEKAQFWSDTNELTALEVTICSGKKIFFDCPECYHCFDITICDVVLKKQWCRFCTHQDLCKDEECEMCFDSSFASTERAKYWSNKNERTARSVFKNSNKKFWFDCHECGHTFDSVASTITKMDVWCRYCNHKDLCDSDECEHCFQASFASSEKAIYWSPNNILSPRQVIVGSDDKYLFDCEVCGNEFASRLAGVRQGRWCSFCKNKTERKLLEYLRTYYPDVIHQFRPKWAISPLKKNMAYDFCIEELKIIIELDGPQHFIQVSNWDTPEKTQERDDFKNRLAVYNGYSVIRLLQKEVSIEKRTKWMGMLHSIINELNKSQNTEIWTMYNNKRFIIEYETVMVFVGHVSHTL
jgi:very-short-patch-repair endonuclease/DNA-directed RNA polymerase subunit RPC12/RpoP